MTSPAAIQQSRRLEKFRRTLSPAAVIAAAVLCFPATIASAVEWNTEHSVSTSFSVSNNTRLAPDGQEETGGTGRLTLGTSMNVIGRRLRFNTDSTLSFIARTNDSNKDIDQALRAVSSFELLENQLFIDGNFSSTRELLESDTAVSGGDAATDEEGRTSVTSISVSPYWQRRYGRWAQSLVRYRHTEVISGEGANNSRNDAAEFQLVGGRKLAPWRPALTSEWSNVDEKASGGRVENDITRFSIGFGNQLALSRRYSLTASIGYDKIDASSDGRDLSGIRWSIGATGRPGPRTSFDISFGQRYGEMAINGSIDYALTARLNLRVQASQSLDTGLQRLVNDANLLTVDPDTGRLVTPAGLPADFGDSGLDDGISVTQNFQATLVGDYGRNRVTLNGFVERREFEVGTENTGRVRGVFTRTLGPRLSASAASFYRVNETVLGTTTHTINGRVDLNYRLGQNATIFGGYAYTKRLSDTPAGEYSEHVGTIGGRVTF